MKKRIFVSICMCVSFLFLVSGCRQEKKAETVSDLAYDNGKEVNEIYVCENNKYVPYIVVTDDYNGNTLLLRREVLDKPLAFNDYGSYYPGSQVDQYLNTTFLKTLTGMQNSILETEIPVTSKLSIGTCGTETETISRKVFLLSCSEADIHSENMTKEGAALEYFKDKGKFILQDKLNEKGIPVSCQLSAERCETEPSVWLRTPNTYYASCPYVIGADNRIGAANAYEKNGVRPAFTVPGNLAVTQSKDIVDGKYVYVFLE